MTSETTLRLRRGFVLSPHGNIEYMEMGEGRPFVWLHQTPRSCMVFRDVMPLIASNYRVIAMSTMGYGQSDRPPQPYTTLHEFGQAVVWLMDGLGIERASLYGAHTGSNVATAVAVDWPEKIESLFLEEPFNWATASRRAVHERIHRYFPERADGGHLVELWNKVGARPGEDLQTTTRRFLDNLIVNDNHETDDVYGSMGWEGAGPYAMCRFDMWEAAVRIQAPTLVMHGTTSELGRSHRKFLDLIPRSKGVIFPSTGNFAPHMAPEPWSAEVLEFMADPSV
jgi:pimeloyl-ACP methyl ester carboxylesterase